MNYYYHSNKRLYTLFSKYMREYTKIIHGKLLQNTRFLLLMKDGDILQYIFSFMIVIVLILIYSLKIYILPTSSYIKPIYNNVLNIFRELQIHSCETRPTYFFQVCLVKRLKIGNEHSSPVGDNFFLCFKNSQYH